MAIDATVGGTSANAYLTVVEATAYFGDRLHNAEWTDATAADQDSSIIWATSILDLVMDWNGSINTQTQALRWPRAGTWDKDERLYSETAIPQIVKNATAELALALIRRERTAEPEILGLGMNKMKADVIDITVDRKEMIGLVPGHVVVMLAQVGVVETDTGRHGRAVRLVRT